MARNRNGFREAVLLTAVGLLSIGGGFLGASAFLGPVDLSLFPGDAPPAPARLSPVEVESFIEEQSDLAGYEDFSNQSRATWDIVADVIYRKLGAYNLQFELTDDPEKNCARTIHNGPGGCYRGNGEYATMIFISPDIDAANAEFIAYHEYSHYLQHRERGTRFVDDPECDADLRTLELRGGWMGSEFMSRCLDYGLSPEQMDSIDDLAVLETDHAEGKS